MSGFLIKRYKKEKAHMKLKLIISSMVILGLASTAVMARISEPKDEALPVNSAETIKYWETILNRNEDNASGVILNQKNHVSVYLTTQVSHTSKRGNSNDQDTYADTSSNNKGKTSLGLVGPEIYFDSQVEPWARVHIATSYDQDFTSNAYTSQNIAYPTQMFFPEAYAALNNFNQSDAPVWLFTKLGRQYVNFTSNQYTVINAPLTAVLGLTNATAVTVGAANWHGLYGDVYGYNGSPYNDNQVPTIPNLNSQNNIHGWGGEIGYSNDMPQGGFTVFANYINNIMDSLSMQNNMFTYSQRAGIWQAFYPDNYQPAYALHADYHTGPFSLLADYVGMLGNFSQNIVSFNGHGANLRAYALEANYSYKIAYPQTISLGWQGSEDAVQFAGIGASFSVPKTRLLAGYKLALSPNISLKFEYMYDQDYARGDCATYNGTSSYWGTGAVNNTLQGRITVVF